MSKLGKKHNQIIANVTINMKVELKQIIDQLTEAVDLNEGFKVCALIEDEDIVGWTIVQVNEDGTLEPFEHTQYKNIKELLDNYRG